MGDEQISLNPQDTVTAKQIRDLYAFAAELAADGRHAAAAEVLALIGGAK